MWEGISLIKEEFNLLLITSASVKGAQGHYLAPPMGLYRLKNYLLDNGLKAEIWDLGYENEGAGKDNYFKRAANGEFSAIGISVSHIQMQKDLEMMDRFRLATKELQRPCLILAGGQEATLNYEQWLDGGIDLIIMGYGEYSLLELCKKYISDPKAHPVDLSAGINGIACRDREGKTVVVPRSALSQEEFEFLSYDRVMEADDVPYKEYWDFVRRHGKSTNFPQSKFVVESIRIYATSHCGRTCGFCSTQSFIREAQSKNSAVQMLTAVQIYNLILFYHKKYSAKCVHFTDDNVLVGSRNGIKRLEALCEMIIESKECGDFPKDFLFNCQTRIEDLQIVDNNRKRWVNRELLRLMKSAGFHVVSLGVETFSGRLQKCPPINKNINIDDIKSVLDTVLEEGLVPKINLILGIPETTVDEILLSMEIGAEYMRKGCQLSVGTAMLSMPGARIYNNPNYEISHIDWVHPYSGISIKIADYYIPFDPEVAGVIVEYRKIAKAEVDRLLDGSPWNENAAPHFVFTMAVFIGFCKILGRLDLVEEYEGLVQDLMKEPSLNIH